MRVRGFFECVESSEEGEMRVGKGGTKIYSICELRLRSGKCGQKSGVIGSMTLVGHSTG